MQRVLVAVLTVLGFAAGFAARVWTESAPPMPPPPRLGGEFTPKSAPPDAKKPLNRADLIAEIQHVRPEIDAYRARTSEIDADFDRDFIGLLNPDQHDKYVADQKKHAARAAEGEAKAAADLTPLSDDQIDRLRQRPLYGVLRMITVKPKVESLTADFKLDAAQQAKVEALLNSRREKFIALLDSTPPPSIRLSALAPVVQKLSEPKK
jgi:hypothetical protein